MVRRLRFGYGKVISLLASVIAFVALCALVGQTTQAAAGINQQINFQGRLFNAQGATVPDGYYNIEFKIYQDGDGQSAGNPSGTLKWTEDYLNTAGHGVEVKNGFMSVQLGSVNPFGANVDWNQEVLWLSMNIAGTDQNCATFAACSPDGEMTPMKRLSSASYSLNTGQLGGLTKGQFVQLAQGIQTDAINGNSIYINKTGTGNIIDLQSGGADVFRVTNGGDLQFGSAAHSISVAAGAGVGQNLSLTAGGAGSGSGLAGGNLILMGGARDGAAESGGVVVKANATNSSKLFTVLGAADNNLFNINSVDKNVNLGSGLTQPVPNLKTPTISTTGGTIANGTTYYYAVSALVGAVETEISPIISYTVNSLTNTNVIHLTWTQSTGATGYKVYRNTSGNFTSGSLLLTTISGGANTTYTDTGGATGAGLPVSTYNSTTFKVDSAANDPFGNGQVAMLGSMYYNTTSGEFQCYKDTGVGGSWSDCGVTTLQGAYNNADETPTAPSIKLDSMRGALSIQDNDTSIGGDLLNVRASNAGGFGAVMFSVGSTGTVTAQNGANQDTAFRVLNQTGQYLLNVNTAKGYFIANTTQPLASQLQNPSFEAGGSVVGGEQGWSGPAQASIVSSSTDAHSGNYELQVTPNGTDLKVYGGNYYEVLAGNTVYLEGWVKNAGGTNGTASVIIEGYDKDKNLISSSSASASLPGATYVLKSTTYTVPSNVAYIRVASLVNSGATSGTFYFDDFYMSGSLRGQQVFRNTENSTTAFAIQSANATNTLLRGDTTNNVVKVGDSTGSDTDTTLLVLDSATIDPTTGLSNRNGGLFYRSDTNSLKAVIGGTVVDICTTAITCSGYSASASTSIQLQTGAQPGTQQTGFFNISGPGYMTGVLTVNTTAASTHSSDISIKTGNASGSSSNTGNITIDTGVSSQGTDGSITIGHSGVMTTMPGRLTIGGNNSLALGTASAATGSILLYNNAGSNTVTIAANGANPTNPWSMVLPQNPGNAGDCLKDSSGTGQLTFSGCDVGITVNLQDVYNNSTSPATITLADSKDLRVVAQDTSTDPSVLFNLQCVNSCGAGGRFAVQNNGTDVFTVNPNSGGIVLAQHVQIGSSTTDSTQTNFQLDSSNQSTDQGTCTTTVNQGAMYYNTSMGALRACLNGSWVDVSSPDTLGLLAFGIVPSSGSNPYDLPAMVVSGASGPCRVSWASSTTVHVEACIAYSGGRRINVSAATLSTNSATTNNISLTTTNRWGHVCLTGSGGQPAFTTTAGQPSGTSGLPTFDMEAPTVCLADVLGSNSVNGQIATIYDARTFTSTSKEAVTLASPAELGMLVDANASGSFVPAVSSSQKMYGVVSVTDGGTSSGAPNAIVTTVGPAWVKANAGTAGQFVKTSLTNGYANTVSYIPNNSFYYSAGNTRTNYTTTCTAASNCNGSLYVNFIVR